LDASGNLGIGTTSPEALLHVNKSNAGGEGGYIYVDNPASSTLNSSVGVRFGTSSGASFASVYTGEISNIITNASTGASALLFGTFNGSASGERMRIDASGNVGIGTSSPNGNAATTGLLHLNGSSTNAEIHLTNTTTGTTGTDGGIFLQYGNQLILFNLENDAMLFGTNNTERMRITSGGNVGIGTSSPSYKLQVEGAFGTSPGAYVSGTTYGTIGANRGASSASAGLNLYSVGSQKWFAGIYENSDNFGFYSVGTNSFPMVINYSTGNVGIGTTSPTSITNYTALTINGTSGSFTEYQQGGSYAFRVGSDNSEGGFISQTTANPIRIFTNSSERMRITSGGNVGIGTTSPTQKLDVVISSGPYNTRFHNSSTSTSDYNVILVTQGASGSATGYFGTGGSAASNTSFANTFVIGTQSNSAFVFNTNDTERMRITSGGDVGIGTTGDASYKLLVKGNNASVDANGQNTIYLSAGTSVSYLATSYIGGGSYVPIAFEVGGSERMRITSGGSLLLGTTTDKTTTIGASGTGQTIGGSGTTNLAIWNTGNADWVYSIAVGNDGTVYNYNKGNTPMLFSTNGTERMRITSGGEVLIGTTSIGAKLTVRDDANTFSTHISANNQTNGIAIGTLSTNNAAIQGYTRTFSATNNIVLQPDGAEVYIAGTTDQGAYNLQVNGTGVWGAGAYVNGSDSALKYNIQPLEPSLDIVKQMNPVTFDYQPFYSKDTTTQTGFIAQDLQRLLADKVYKNGIVKEGGAYLGVAYENIIPLLVKAIQELEAKVENLKSQLNNR